MPKNKQSNLIANVKMPNIGFINKYYKLRNKGEGKLGGNYKRISGEIINYLVLVNYPSLLSNIFPLAPPIIFLYKI